MKQFSFNFPDEQLRETAVFLLKMMFAGVIFRAVLFLDPSTYIFQQWLVSATNFSLQFIGVELAQNGILLGSGEKAYLVTRDCLGWKSMAAFTALMFASTSHTRWKKIFKPLLLGLVALTLINFFRVFTTVYLSYQGIISFEIIHTVFWRWGMTFAVLLLWFAWLKTGSQDLRTSIKNVLKRDTSS